MKTVTIQEAKTLLDEAAPGTELSQEPRQFGGWEGKVRIAPDFDEVNEEIAQLFVEGGVQT